MFFFHQHPLSPAIFKNALRLRLPSAQTQEHVLLVKEHCLELVLFDTLSGSWISIHEQPVFGSVYDAVVLPGSDDCHLSYPQESSSTSDMILDFETSINRANRTNDTIVCLSDSGKLSLVVLKEVEVSEGIWDPLRFESIQEIKLVDPDMVDYKQIPRNLATDPTHQYVLASCVEDSMILFRVFNHGSTVSIYADMGRQIEELGTLWDIKFLHQEEHRAKLGVATFVVLVNRNSTWSIVPFEFTPNDSGGSLQRGTPFILFDGCSPLHLTSLPNLPNCILLTLASKVMLFELTTTPNMNKKFILHLEKNINPKESFDSSVSYSHIITNTIAIKSQPIGLSEPMQSVYIFTDLGFMCLLQIPFTLSCISYTDLGLRNHLISAHHLTSSNDGSQDYFAILGDMCDGEIVSIDHVRQRISQKAVLSHWSPVLDFKLVREDTETEFRSNMGADSLYMACGLGQGGQIVKVKKGVKVDVETEVPTFEGVTGLWSLKAGGANSVIDSYLAISFVADTRLMCLTDDALEDISETCGFLLDVKTIVASSLNFPNTLMQVHKKGVVVTRPNHDSLLESITTAWIPRDHEEIVLASTLNNIIYVVTGYNNIYILKVSIQDDSRALCISEEKKIRLDFEPSCISILPRISESSSDKILVGSYTPSLFDISFEDDFEMRKEYSLVSAGNVTIRVPNSIVYFEYRGFSYVAVGLRDGSLVIYTHSKDGELILFDEINIGDKPVQLVKSSSNTECSYLIALAEASFKIDVSKTRVIASPISFGPIVAATPFTRTSRQNDFVFSVNGNLSIVQLDTASKCNIEKIRLQQSPKRMIFDSVFNVFLVACNKMDGENNGMGTGRICLVDPKSDVQRNLEILPKGESCTSLIVWNVKEGKRYICLGTWGYKATPTSDPEGRVLVYSLKIAPESNSYKMKRLGEYKFPLMVQMICVFMNSYLLVGTGNVIYQLKIESVSRTIVAGNKLQLRWPVRSLSTYGNHIFVGGLRDSISLYSYNPKTKAFTFMMSDDMSRVPGDSLAIDEACVIASDRSGNIFGLVNPLALPSTTTGRPHHQSVDQDDYSFQTAFTVHVGEIVMRLHRGSLDYGVQMRQGKGKKNLRKGLESVFLPLSMRASHAMEASDDDGDMMDQEIGNRKDGKAGGGLKRVEGVYGCSVSGSIFSIHRISRDMYERFMSLQRVLLSMRVCQPLLGNDHARYRKSGKSSMGVVDGEVISMYNLLKFEEKMKVVNVWNQVWRESDPYAYWQNILN